jgi:hypothetical protein
VKFTEFELKCAEFELKCAALILIAQGQKGTVREIMEEIKRKLKEGD